MKILLLAGEESGILYADALKARLGGHEVRGYQDYGFETHDLAVMGIVAVLVRIFYFLRVKRTMKRAIDEWRPDAVLTVDYPGMNLRLAAYAKAKGIRTVHVVCPQVWAWKRGRIPKIEASLDRLCCFFPFEPALFTAGFATFVGHPLAAAFPADQAGHQTGLVALLPGSRTGEVRRNLPVMLEAAYGIAAEVPGVKFVIPAANQGASRLVRKLVGKREDIEVLDGGARELLMRADAAVVASGTATLEAALARCPTVLVYKVSALLAFVARRVIKGVRHLGLANILWEKSGGTGAEPMPELLQEDFTPERTAAVIIGYLTDSAERSAAVARLDAAVRLLDGAGDPVGRIVKEIL